MNYWEIETESTKYLDVFIRFICRWQLHNSIFLNCCLLYFIFIIHVSLRSLLRHRWLLQIPVLSCLIAKLMWHFNNFIVTSGRARPECFIMACFFHGYLRFVVNGLWLFVTLFLADCLSKWRPLNYIEQLRRLQELNGHIGVLLAFLVGATVFDAISSMVSCTKKVREGEFLIYFIWILILIRYVWYGECE